MILISDKNEKVLDDLMKDLKCNYNHRWKLKDSSTIFPYCQKGDESPACVIQKVYVCENCSKIKIEKMS